MLLPLGTHRRTDPIGRPSFAIPSHSSPARASRTSEFSPRYSDARRGGRAESGRKESNLQPPPE